MKSKHKLMIAGFLITTSLIGLGKVLYSKNSNDFIKLSNVEYSPPPFVPTVSFNIEAHDDEGIRELQYYIDGKPFYESGSSRDSYFRNSPKEIEITKTIFNGRHRLKKGKHTLKVILKDCEENIIKGKYTFEIQ